MLSVDVYIYSPPPLLTVCVLVPLLIHTTEFLSTHSLTHSHQSEPFAPHWFKLHKFQDFTETLLHMTNKDATTNKLRTDCPLKDLKDWVMNFLSSAPFHSSSSLCGRQSQVQNFQNNTRVGCTEERHKSKKQQTICLFVHSVSLHYVDFKEFLKKGILCCDTMTLWVLSVLLNVQIELSLCLRSSRKCRQTLS